MPLCGKQQVRSESHEAGEGHDASSRVGRALTILRGASSGLPMHQRACPGRQVGTPVSGVLE
eukprot:jgi/Mesvir1/14246/Mv25154-RA.1